jgi:hypothetical protein
LRAERSNPGKGEELDCFVALLLAMTNEGSMKILLTVLGIILLLAGLVWMGQGSGYFPYPAESFMISQVRWVYYGGCTALLGLIVLIFAR